MPCLVIFNLPAHPNTGYQPYDIVEVLPHDQHPGTSMVEGKTRFGFVYVTDRTRSEMRMYLEPEYSKTEIDPDGVPVRANRRQWAVDVTTTILSGAYTKYSPYGDPAAVELTYLDFIGYTVDKSKP